MPGKCLLSHLDQCPTTAQRMHMNAAHVYARICDAPTVAWVQRGVVPHFEQLDTADIEIRRPVVHESTPCRGCGIGEHVSENKDQASLKESTGPGTAQYTTSVHSRPILQRKVTQKFYRCRL